jgi:hypothetical protein
MLLRKFFSTSRAFILITCFDITGPTSYESWSPVVYRRASETILFFTHYFFTKIMFNYTLTNVSTCQNCLVYLRIMNFFVSSKIQVCLHRSPWFDLADISVDEKNYSKFVFLSYLNPVWVLTVGAKFYFCNCSHSTTHTRTHTHTHTHTLPVGLLWARDSLVAVTSTLRRQHSQQTDNCASGGTQTNNPSKREAADPRLRPHGHPDGLQIISLRDFVVIV